MEDITPYIVSVKNLAREDVNNQLHAIFDNKKENNELKNIVLEDINVFIEIVKYKQQSIDENLHENNIEEIVKFLEKDYYNHDKISQRVDNVLRFLFTPPYYNSQENFKASAPVEFWATPLGRVIISCLAAEDDILVSTLTVSKILKCKRQNVNVIINKNKIPNKKIGGIYLFKLWDVVAYKNRSKRGAGKNV